MQGQKSYSPRTIFAVISLPSSQLVGTGVRTHRLENRQIERQMSKTYMPEPLYVTEMDVTRAIASGTFIGFAPTAYETAKQYQAYLKAQKRRTK
jgi:hypothetical protein